MAVAAMTLGVGAASAAAASPREIYRDWADNGQLDKAYSQADLEAALRDSTLQGYGDDGFEPTVNQAIGQQQQQAGPGALGETQESGTLPFTGADVAVFAGAAVVLLLLGFGMRRIGRSKA